MVVRTAGACGYTGLRKVALRLATAKAILPAVGPRSCRTRGRFSPVRSLAHIVASVLVCTKGPAVAGLIVPVVNVMEVREVRAPGEGAVIVPRRQVSFSYAVCSVAVSGEHFSTSVKSLRVVLVRLLRVASGANNGVAVARAPGTSGIRAGAVLLRPEKDVLVVPNLGFKPVSGIGLLEASA